MLGVVIRSNSRLRLKVHYGTRMFVEGVAGEVAKLDVGDRDSFQLKAHDLLVLPPLLTRLASEGRLASA